MHDVRIKDVNIDFLLGREASVPKPELMSANIRGKVVMVTGAGGSIGSELCRQILKYDPKLLVMLDISEYSLYTIQVELLRTYPQDNMVAILGSVQNDVRVNKVLRKFEVQTVYHAAAYKHVPMVEYNISEGIINNIIGTKTMVEECHYNEVETFVLVSTDKAVRPTNVMGASKRIAELLVQGMAARGGKTTYSMVRFGNVLGSSGSVVPTFLEQLSRREALTVTHKDITRYFMSIPEAAQLVIQAGAMADGGEVFVLDMGKPVRIYDLARNMIDWYDDPWGKPIEITGLRPGEKLYEELLIGDDVSKTDHPMICKANEEFIDYDNLRQDINYLRILCDADRYDVVVEWISNIVPGFNHSGEIKDYLSS